MDHLQDPDGEQTAEDGVGRGAARQGERRALDGVGDAGLHRGVSSILARRRTWTEVLRFAAKLGQRLGEASPSSSFAGRLLVVAPG